MKNKKIRNVAQIGYCYGSEWYLMRYMARHRKYLESLIDKKLGSLGGFDWLDFEYDESNQILTGDKELSGLGWLKQCVVDSKYRLANLHYYKYGINNPDEWQFWDAVFVRNDVVYLVEAKSYAEEFESNREHGGRSRNAIFMLMQDELRPYGVEVNEKWLGKYYQFANRLATAAMLNNQGVKTKVLYICFVNANNGRIVDRDGNRISDEEPIGKPKCSSYDGFDMVLQNELDYLGITKEQVADIYAGAIYVDVQRNGNDVYISHI
ncbi:MAG: hypothetical protein IKR17_11530 [Bacteroidales bacterium]|nr:hypothetical protein [Bacteroidales bacterium]